MCRALLSLLLLSSPLGIQAEMSVRVTTYNIKFRCRQDRGRLGESAFGIPVRYLLKTAFATPTAAPLVDLLQNIAAFWTQHNIGLGSGGPAGNQGRGARETKVHA